MEDLQEVIEQLSHSDALSILQALARSDAQLGQRIVEMAMECLSEVDPEEIGAELYESLDALEVEEVWDRARETRHGYVETGEAAYQMIEDVLEPFLEELHKYQKLGLHAEANQMCMGLLLGLYQFEHESTSKFKDWAPDAPSAFAETVVRAWKEGSPGRDDVQTLKVFVEQELGRWVRSLF